MGAPNRKKERKNVREINTTIWHTWIGAILENGFCHERNLIFSNRSEFLKSLC
jgi:hypothetical protein